MVPRVLTIGIRAMASKTTTTTKFEVEKFDGKSNFLLWKMRVTSLLVKEGTRKALLGIEKKPSKTEDDEWNDIDFLTKAMINCAYQMRGPLQRDERGDNGWSFV